MRKLMEFWVKNIASVRLDFGSKDHQKELTLTFNFIAGITWILALLIGMWSLSAGIVESGKLTLFIQSRFLGKGFWVHQANWLGPIVGVPIYALKAFAITMVVCFAASCVGALVGFLFGVPRPVSENTPIADRQSASSGGVLPTGGHIDTTVDNTLLGSKPALSTSAAPAGAHPTASKAAPGPAWQASTNLTQISDWLTKIIVGVGLVEATKIYSSFTALSASLGSSLFAGELGVSVLVPSVLIAGFVIGFMYSYLFTQLFLAALMAYSATVVSAVSASLDLNSAAAILNLPSASSTLAPSISLVGSDEPGPYVQSPTPAQTNAATKIITTPLDQLEEPAEIQIWARAQALLNHYAEAATGYVKVLKYWTTPEVLGEAARVFAANKDVGRAKQLLSEALKGRNEVAPDVRSRITFDAANVALYAEPPGGFTRALELLDEETMRYDPIGSLHVLRACANGQKYRYYVDDLNQEGKARFHKTVYNDLKFALDARSSNREWIRYLWDPNAPEKVKSQGPKDDDLEPFFDCQDFRDLIVG